LDKSDKKIEDDNKGDVFDRLSKKRTAGDRDDVNVDLET